MALEGIVLSLIPQRCVERKQSSSLSGMLAGIALWWACLGAKLRTSGWAYDAHLQGLLTALDRHVEERPDHSVVKPAAVNVPPLVLPRRVHAAA